MNNSEDTSNKENNDASKVPDFLKYPPSEDIYRQGKKEEEIDPSDSSKMKQTISQNIANERNELDFETVKTGEDLDVPGSELDDKMEQVGSEDEENNYYSIGGDNHEDLEENKGENDL
ncbi:hypothetical protein [Flavobacterium sp. SM2513]|uniref:hypothetical protein n=1 Tax=Flavobacterium sp. SM2513 TaxID=3424766 RepID=UPI003D7F5009